MPTDNEKGLINLEKLLGDELKIAVETHTEYQKELTDRIETGDYSVGELVDDFLSGNEAIIINLKAREERFVKICKVLVEALEAPHNIVDADLMFVINGADNDFSHIPYNDVKKIALRTAQVLARRQLEALNLAEQIAGE